MWDPPTVEVPGPHTVPDTDMCPGGVNVGPDAQNVSAGGMVRLLIRLPMSEQAPWEGGGSSPGGNSQAAMTWAPGRGPGWERCALGRTGFRWGGPYCLCGLGTAAGGRSQPPRTAPL